MELKPDLGFDNIKFGINETDVQEILGKPDRAYYDQDENGEVLIWEYNKLKTRLTFYIDKTVMLSYIDFSNPDLEYNGKKILGSSFEYAKNEIFGNKIQDWDKTESNSFISYFNKKHWITLQEEFNEITIVEIGVPLINYKQFMWPGLEKFR